MFSTDSRAGAKSVENTPVPLLLLALAVPVFFLYLGANSIWDANEAFYVETPRQMVQSGDYITPTFNGQPRLNKPVLSYWIVAGLYRAFGESVTVERAGTAVGAMGIVLAAFLIGRALRSTATGVLSALFVATAPRVVWFSRRIFIDIYLTTFLSLALASCVLAERRPAHRRRYLLAMYFFIALGVLTKGPIAVALPALVAIIWLATGRRLADLKRWLLVPGAVIMAAIVLPWYQALYVRYGWTYIKSFLLTENLGRYTSAMTPDGRGPLFYLPVLLGDLFPWAPLVLVPLIGIPRAWQRLGRSSRDPAASLRWLLWVWIAVFVAVFSISRTKEDLYILPTVVAVAALVADALVDRAEGARRRALDVLFTIVTGLCVAAAPVLFWLFGPTAGYYAIGGARTFAVILGLTGLIAGALWLGRQPLRAVAALAAGFVVLNYVLVAYLLPDIERTKPVPPLVRTLAAVASPNAKIGYFNMGLQSFVYYTGRGAIEEIGNVDQAEAFFYDRRESWALMGADEWVAVHARVPNTCIADRHPLSVFDAKLEDMISRTPPLEVLLVRNNCAR